MRLLSAIIVSGLILIPHAAWSETGDESSQQTQERNPIEWFLSDLGSLFATAVKSLDQNADNLKTVSNEDELVVEPSTMPVFADARGHVDLDDDLFGEHAFDLVITKDSTSTHLEASGQTKPSISDFFRDIINALSQSAQSNLPETITASDHVTESAAFDFEDEWSTLEAGPVSSQETKNDLAQGTPENDFFKTLEAAAAAYENDDGQISSDAPRPSVGDLFASIVTAFTGEGVSNHAEETADADNDNIEQMDAVDAAPVKSISTEQELIVEVPAIHNDVAEHEEFDAAPWQVAPHVAVFAPEADIFDESETPASAPQATIPMAVETADVSGPAPVIRKRIATNPAARNHLSLGRTEAADLPEEETSFLNHLVETFIGEDTESSDQSEVLASKIPDHLVPEEKLDLGYTAPDAITSNDPADELTTIGEGILKNIDLYLGANTVIGQPYQPNTHSSGACIERSLQVSIFCVAGIDWPSQIAESFAQDTAFTLPGEGVIRYENGRVSRVYTPFKAQDFAEVVKFMQSRFGPPLEREIVWMHMIEAPKMPNTTFRWRAVSADRKDSVVLEVRNFDDLRRSFADLNRGMVRLYRDGSRPIFKYLSTMDLMLIQRRRVSQAPVAPHAGSSAN